MQKSQMEERHWGRFRFLNVGRQYNSVVVQTIKTHSIKRIIASYADANLHRAAWLHRILHQKCPLASGPAAVVRART